MNRLILAVTGLLGLAGPALARADAPPSTPDGLRATLYDKAGGELFWQRSTDDRGAVRGYEITRNGQSLGIRDALSYYDPSLEPGTPYTFTVVAIDGAGQRSGVASTTLGDAAPPPASDGPDAPAALRSDVYSRRSAELFWRREPAALGLRYEIRRDGRIVGTTNGVSYYTRDLAAGSDYAFEVIAIDPAGRRSAPSSTTVRTAGEGVSPPPAATGPEAPRDLRADVYSRRSAELFWRREPAALALSYEIRRDERVVGTTNGVSYFTRDLASGTDYTFEVIAIASDGTRSRAASLPVSTSGMPAPPVPAPVEAPRDLRSDVYSGRAIELFWARSTTLLAPRYEVARDGTVIGTTNGTSFYDDTLAGGTSYAYTVTTLDGERRSAAATTTLSTPGSGAVEPSPPPADDPFAEPDPAGASALARLGYPAARDLAAEVVSGAYLGLYLDVDERVNALLSESDTLERTVRCAGGGTARGRSTGFGGPLDLEFAACTLDGRTLTGRLVRTEGRFPIAVGQIAELDIVFDALRIDAGDAGALTVTGSFERSEGSGQDRRCNGYVSSSDTVTIESARLERGGEVSTVTDATYLQRRDRRDFGNPNDETTPCSTRRTLETRGAATVISTRLGAEPATLSNASDVTRGSSGTTDVRVVPTLEADFGDGSTLAVTATSDTDDTVQVDLTGEGVSISFEDDYAFEPRDFGVSLLQPPLRD